ncbi:hypothetical protein Hanom_Chr03g00217701 [Helianthus anomalus]
MNRADPIFRVVNRFCILCLIGSRVGSGNGRVGSGFSFCSPLLAIMLTNSIIITTSIHTHHTIYTPIWILKLNGVHPRQAWTTTVKTNRRQPFGQHIFNLKRSRHITNMHNLS